MSTACLSSSTYKHAVRVGPREIDFMGHVNNANYLTWIQDAVIAHWRQHAGADAVDAYAWIAIKHEITYRKPALLHDEVIVVADLKSIRRESAFYDTTVMRGSETLATANSRWCCINAETSRPTRLPAAVAERFLPKTYLATIGTL